MLRNRSATANVHLVWDIEPPIKVRVYSEVALIRYEASIEIVVQGQGYPRARYWHTDAYENRAGHWQVIWSPNGHLAGVGNPANLGALAVARRRFATRINSPSWRTSLPVPIAAAASFPR